MGRTTKKISSQAWKSTISTVTHMNRIHTASMEVKKRTSTVTSIFKPMRGDRGGQVMLVVLALVMVLVPVLNLVVPAGNPWHVPTYVVTLLGKYLTFALLAVAVDLVWGYLGILSLGHGAFFALGGYAMGMYLMRQIGERGVYGDPVLPDYGVPQLDGAAVVLVRL